MIVYLKDVIIFRKGLFRLAFLLNLFGCFVLPISAQKLWHGKERTVHYQPDGKDFVCLNGKQRFNRALYGTNTAFRVEAGDLPEFAMYMPGMGGNIKFGLSANDSSKWLINADKIIARYSPGRMLYEIEDKMLGRGKLKIVVLAMGDAEGIVIKLQFENVSPTVKLICAYGGASGKKFSRDGDMGPDPESSFYLKPTYCTDNIYKISNNQFKLQYGTGVLAEWDPYVNKNLASDTVKPVKIGKEQNILGVFPLSMSLQVADANQQASPNQLYQSKQSNVPVIVGSMDISSSEPYFFVIKNEGSGQSFTYAASPQIFSNAEKARVNIAERVTVVTPDKYINTLGGVLATAADAIWESPSYMHGSIGWRMRLNGWRGPYVADVLSWHDRAQSHFKAYSLSQVTAPLNGPVIMDSSLHLARSLEKMGTSIFSSGYISRNPSGDFRPHHYDMNLVYIDAMLRHFKWTGDVTFAKEMWPIIKRHLAWEKRNFDSDGDGLYDAYAAIWASDALQYSGGSVTHSSAYNYKANKEAAVIARLIGEDGSLYEAEAVKILKAINTTLWMPIAGSYAEYKDLLGNQLLHPSAAVWTIYHAIDSDVPDPFQAYQSARYIENFIPHIPVMAKGLDSGFYTISTSKWMPYDWSLNNVVTAEVMHTALANWQAGQNEKGFNLFKSELLSTMYLGGSPGNIGQISYYDAARGEAYRDFADPVAMTARSLVEGLFGILPNALKGELIIKPGFPASWNSATISIPDISIDFKRNGKEDLYTIFPRFTKKMNLKLVLKANGSKITGVTVNGKNVVWSNVGEAIETPTIEINAGMQNKYVVKIFWSGTKATTLGAKAIYVNGSQLDCHFSKAIIQKILDPQNILAQVQFKNDQLVAVVEGSKGSHSVFVQLKQNEFSWWQPVNINIVDAVEINALGKQSANKLQFTVHNNTAAYISGKLSVNNGNHLFEKELKLPPSQVSSAIVIDSSFVLPGTNEVSFSWNGLSVHQHIINWDVDGVSGKTESVDLSNQFNDHVTNIFKNQYLSPRPNVATLQLPTQGIGDWTHPLKTVVINDRGLRKLAGGNNQLVLPQGIVFNTPSDTLKPNILFTSQWDNYPKEAIVSLSGKASHAYLLMAGSTNPMQSRLVNGAVIIFYSDNTADTLVLKNPESWWPIEQDFKEDGFAFTIDAPRPIRIHLKTGKMFSEKGNSIEIYNGKMIDGGAATVLDLPLDPSKYLKGLKLQTIANDVVIGLMSVTLQR